MSQAVYVMEDQKTHLLKIGISAHPTFRAKEVSKEFGCNAVVLGILRVDNALETERFIHGMLASHRVVGEWFELGPQERAYLLAYFSEKPKQASKPSEQPDRHASKNPWSEIRERTRAAMRAAGLTQRDLAATTGIHANNISRMLRDDDKGVGTTPENWQKLLDALSLKLTVEDKDNGVQNS